MADLSDVQAAQSVKIIGSDSAGLENNPVTATSNGALHSNLRNDAGTEIATASNPIRIDPTGTTSQPVVGNVAAGASDSGNPIKIGGKYTTTIPLLTDGQRGDTQLDENSFLSTIPNFANYTAQQKTYSVTTTSALTVGTSETSIFLFRNPNSNPNKVRLLRLQITGAATYRLYHTPTITSNGTTLTSINQRIMTSPTAAQALPTQSPTISANGTFMMPLATSTQAGTLVFDLSYQPILNPNFTILITAQAGGNNTPVNVTLVWCEVP